MVTRIKLQDKCPVSDTVDLHQCNSALSAQSESIEFRLQKSRPIGERHVRFKLGVVIFILATALSTATYAANKGGGGGGGHGGGGGDGGAAAVAGMVAAVADMPAAVVAMRALPAAVARVTSAPDRVYPVRRCAKLTHQSIYDRPCSREQCRRPNDAAQCNRERHAQCKRTVNPNLKSNAVRTTLKGPSVAGALRRTSALRDPRSRSHITASAATAGWHGGRDGGNGWWRHGNGGYGWVGPLYWPFAYYDMYDYAMWGDGYDDSFWDYGYGDIYAGIFAPYGYDDLTGYLPQYASGNPSETAPRPLPARRPQRPMS